MGYQLLKNEYQHLKIHGMRAYLCPLKSVFFLVVYLQLVVQKLVGYSYLVSSEQTIQEQYNKFMLKPNQALDT